MIQRLVRGIVTYGVTTGGIKEDDREVYTYGYTLLLETSICIVAMGCIGALFNLLFEVIVFSIVFIPLRSLGGGVHAKKEWQCLTLSLVVITMYCIILKWGCDEKIHHFVLMLTIVGVIISQSKIKNIQYGSFLNSKKIITCMCFIWVLTSFVLLRLGEEGLAEGILIAVFVWVISILLKKEVN